MEGNVSRGALGLESSDPVLSMLGCLGLAISARTALVVDLLGDLVTRRSLGDFIEDGPALSELSPGRSGVALIGGGGISGEVAAGLIESLARVWPAVVVRCGARSFEGPVVPLKALLPGLLSSHDVRPAVWQSCGTAVRPPGPGPILPRPSPRLVRGLLMGRMPSRGRWIRAWDRVWEMPWA